MKFDIYIKVKFRISSEGGRKASVKRKSPLAGDFYACPLIVDKNTYDCRLFIGDQELELGKYYEIPVKFLDKELALKNLSVGKHVILWEGREIADGQVIRVCN